MLASGLNLNHWLLDTSVLHQVVLAPAVSPKWSVDLIILIISIGLGLIGAVAFNRRDLETE
jgi:putative exporter of polyketide antibiotics